MGFFDDALNKTKEVLDAAYKKTEEVVTTEKQKLDVAGLKSKREKDYAALGKIYYEAIRNNEDLDDEVKALVEAIDQKNAEIDRLNSDIQSAKNRRICPNCGVAIAENSVYCNACGIKLTIE